MTNRNKPVFVTLPFDDYKELEDILWELNSPTLLKSIELGRKEYLQGKTKELTKVLKEINDVGNSDLHFLCFDVPLADNKMIENLQKMI